MFQTRRVWGVWGPISQWLAFPGVRGATGGWGGVAGVRVWPWTGPDTRLSPELFSGMNFTYWR